MKTLGKLKLNEFRKAELEKAHPINQGENSLIL